MFVCTAITCTGLSAPANGMVVFSSGMPYGFGTVATYSCNSGSTLNGDATRTCGGDGLSTSGTWNGTAPTCQCKV